MWGWSMHRKFTDDTKLGGAVDVLGVKACLQNFIEVNWQKYYEVKANVELCIWDGAILCNSTLDKRGLCRKGLKILVDNKLNVSWQCALTTKKMNCTLSPFEHECS